MASLIAVSNTSSVPINSQAQEPVSGKSAVEASASNSNSQIVNRPGNAVVEMIKDASQKYGVDENLAIEIARCESTLRQYGTDGNVVRGMVNSKDVGVFQINEDFHLRQSQEQGFDIYTTRGNIEYAVSILKKSGNKPWSASKPCWGRHVAMN